MEIKVTLLVFVEPDEDRFYAYCPALKGLHVDGDTEDEAFQNAADGATAYLNALMKRGEPLPVGLHIDHCRPSLMEVVKSSFWPQPHHRQVTTAVHCTA